MMLSEANDVGLALIIGVGLFWAVNLPATACTGRPFWTLFLGLPASVQ